MVGTGKRLVEACPEINFQRLRERVASGREYACETTIKVKRRSVTLAMPAMATKGSGHGTWGRQRGVPSSVYG